MKVDYKNLSLEDKIKLLSGKEDNAMQSEDLNGKAYAISMSDGPIGPHYPEPHLWLPSSTCLSNTWNLDIVRQYVDALSDICVINNVDMLLAPAINIKRNPLCGRNFEYYSEDPYLTGQISKTFVETLQNRGISSCVKHFAANNREYSRLLASSNMDKRTLREIYTKAFEITIESNPWAIMCSYNKINGEYASQNEEILKQVLRNELHFNNVIVSDWGAVHNRALALKASLDLEMPYPSWYDINQNIHDGLNEGLISEKDIDDSVNRIESLTNKILEAKQNRYVKYNDENRHEIALKTLLEGIVLLKNEDDILPLKNGVSIGVFGDHAFKPEMGGGGSCNLADDPNADYDKRYVKPQKGLPALLKEYLDKSKIEYAQGYECQDGFGKHYRLFASLSVDRIAENSDVSIAVVGTNRCIECEGYDRETLKLDTIQLDVIKEVINHSKNVVVIIEAGGVVDVSEFKDDVKAILYVPFGGDVTNEAITKLIVGDANPCGKLTETFIKDVSINPYIHKRDMYNEEYNDGVYVGYRLYETKNIKVEYPFGHGLSYTRFAYSNLKIEQNKDGFILSYDITNCGNQKGKEISQIYIDGRKAYANRPKKELIGFAKIELNPNEAKRIKHEFKNKSLAYFDEEINDWKVNSGEYEIMVGSSVADIKLIKEIRL